MSILDHYRQKYPEEIARVQRALHDGTIQPRTHSAVLVSPGPPPHLRQIDRHWRRFQAARMSRLAPELRQLLLNNRSVYLFGGTGTGKTFALVALFRRLSLLTWLASLRRHRYSAPWNVGIDAETIILVSYLDLMDDLRRDISDPDGRRFEGLAEADVLLVDDLGSGKVTAWQAERFERLLDLRHRDPRLVTHYSSNHNLVQLRIIFSQAYSDDGGAQMITLDSDRIASRIGGSATPYQLSGPDRRLQRPDLAK